MLLCIAEEEGCLGSAAGYCEGMIKCDVERYWSTDTTLVCVTRPSNQPSGKCLATPFSANTLSPAANTSICQHLYLPTPRSVNTSICQHLYLSTPLSLSVSDLSLSLSLCVSLCLSLCAYCLCLACTLTHHSSPLSTYLCNPPFFVSL